MEIGQQHLTVVLNALYETGRDTIPVSHPSDELDELCTLHLEEGGTCRLDFHVDAAEYATRRSTINETYGEPAITEIPGRQSFLNALLASGILETENQDEVESFLDRYGSPDLTAGHHPVVAGFDTNLMPWRIGDVLGLNPGSEGIINGYTLATGVRDELVWSHKRQDTRSLEEAFGPAFDELWNQPRGPDREGRLGRSYYRTLRDQRYAEEIETDTGDESIVAGFDEFQTDGRKQVLLFSNDRDFIERAQGHTVLAQWVDLPEDVPATVDAGWDEVQAMLYYLAVLFGVIELPTMTVFGVWNGKGGQAWHHDRVKVDSRSSTITPRVERDLKIIAAYED